MAGMPPPTQIKILLVEDDALIALDMEMSLERAGYLVTELVTRLEAAVEFAATGAFDLALLDVHLDGAPIWPVTEVLQRRRIPFVLCTGYLSSANVPPSCAGAPRLSKPVNHDVLIKTISDLIKFKSASSD